MPTISQLPAAGTVSPTDLIPISQGGSAHSVSVGSLLAQTQPAIMVTPPALLGRISIGAGGPDSIALGDGLSLNSGTLSVSTLNTATLTVQPTLSPGDQFMVMNGGVSQLAQISQVREIFSAGSNISIDSNGVISASAESSASTSSLAGLPSISSLASNDLIGVTQNDQAFSVTYSNFLDGLTIDQAQEASSASDTDVFWVAQTSGDMVRQSLAALWPWMIAKLPLWYRPVIEINVVTTLSETAHNGAVLVCSQPVSINIPATSLPSGFYCEVINMASSAVGLGGGIITSNGATNLLPFQSTSIRCVTYSCGTVVFAAVTAGETAATVPGQVAGLTASSILSNEVTLSWSAPVSGGGITAYSVQYRVTGTGPWLIAGQSTSDQNFTVNSLQPMVSYDFAVAAENNIGSGALSSTLTVTTAATSPKPGAPTGLTVSNITANSVTLTWSSPSNTIGATTYEVQYRMTGQTSWSVASNAVSSNILQITGLVPATSYDMQVTASDSNGTGAPSAVVTAETASSAGQVISISWNLVPSGSYTHGVGAIGLNAHVNPASAPVQFGFSTSPTTPPGSWTLGANVNSDLWGQYVATPATAGSWYAWVEGTDGSAPTVYATPFTVG